MQHEQMMQAGLGRRLTPGGILILLGIAILVLAWAYPTGQLTDMGPGYMPKLIALALMAMGGAVLVTDLRAGAAALPPGLNWRGLVFISAAVVVFALLVPKAGLVPAMFGAVALSMLADSSFSPLGIALYSAAVTFFSWLLFIPALGLPLSAFGG